MTKAPCPSRGRLIDAELRSADGLVGYLDSIQMTQTINTAVTPVRFLSVEEAYQKAGYHCPATTQRVYGNTGRACPECGRLIFKELL